MSRKPGLALITGLALCSLAAACGAPEVDGTGGERAAQGLYDPSGYPNCPGLGWSDVGSDSAAWVGLKGTFLRNTVAPYDEISAMTAYAEPYEANPVAATVTIGGIPRTGTLRAYPSNPAIGPTLLFHDAAGNTMGVYFALRLVRSAFTGKINNVCLAFSAGPDGYPPSNAQRQIFMMSRYGF